MVFQFRPDLSTTDSAVVSVAEKLEGFFQTQTGQGIKRRIPADKAVVLLDYKSEGEIGDSAKCTFAAGKFETQFTRDDPKGGCSVWDADTPLSRVVALLVHYGDIPISEVLEFIINHLTSAGE